MFPTRRRWGSARRATPSSCLANRRTSWVRASTSRGFTASSRARRPRATSRARARWAGRRPPPPPPPPPPPDVRAIAVRQGVPARAIGEVRPAVDGFAIVAGAATLRISPFALRAAYHDALPRAVGRGGG